MNVNIARAYFDKNGFIFIVTNRFNPILKCMNIRIAKFTDFDLAYVYFRNDPTSEFLNLTQAKMKGWNDNGLQDKGQNFSD